MVDIERHRGPDAAGSLVQGPAAIGMRRLSIIDLAGGDQPIFNEDRSMAIVFNGEIFNYVELKEELAGKGHVFRTNSDTEVLVHLYEECGTAMLARLNGMFAFAIWDRRRQSIFLARDRMGVKPLYYTAAGRRWLFASELKCLLTQPETNTRLDLDAVADFLRLGYIPRDATPYQAVRKLLPGHSLFIDDSGGRVERWWDLAEGFNPEPATEAELRRELEEIFDDAVRIRMRSDVPVASFLSGGLDSSLVTVTAQRQSDIPLRTFTMAFENTEFDETGYAQAVASHAGTVHSVNTASPRTAMSHLPLLLWHMDEPMGDSSIIPNYLITHFAAQQVKVCLSGLGGDELFGGYARYNDPCRGRIRRLFSIAPNAAGVLAPVLDPFMLSWAEELRVASGSSNDWRTYLHRLQTFDTAGLRALGFPTRGRAENTVEDLWKRYPGTDSISRRQFVDQHTYLPDQILALTDRMSMANSLEVRVPFMDYRLVRFSQRLTSAVKQTPSDFKIFLKRVLGDRCPPEILSRPKWGFDTPLKKWVTRPELFQFIQRLPEGVAVREGLFRADTVRAMVATPDMVTNAARKVWNLAVLEVWLRTARRPEPPRESLPELLEATECAAR